MGKCINQMQRHEMEWRQPTKYHKTKNGTKIILFCISYFAFLSCSSRLANNLKRRFAEFSADVRPLRHWRLRAFDLGMGMGLGLLEGLGAMDGDGTGTGTESEVLTILLYLQFIYLFIYEWPPAILGFLLALLFVSKMCK